MSAYGFGYIFGFLVFYRGEGSLVSSVFVVGGGGLRRFLERAGSETWCVSIVTLFFFCVF